MLSKLSFPRLRNCHVASAKLALALAVLATGAQAATIELVQNGGFEQLAVPGAARQLSPGWQEATGWTSGSLPTGSSAVNFVFLPGTADTTGSVYGPDAGPNVGVPIYLWGPGNGSANGLPATSPQGGNFLGLDGDPTLGGPLSQTITGLIPGQEATLTFWWAAAQQAGFLGDTTERLQVSLGGEMFTTETLLTPQFGFQPWRQASFTFTPTSSSDMLSFLAIGTPIGGPPFLLLDGVSLTQEVPDAPVPEPASLVLLGAGLAGIGFARLRRK